MGFTMPGGNRAVVDQENSNFNAFFHLGRLTSRSLLA
jgi:hypothetical protein